MCANVSVATSEGRNPQLGRAAEYGAIAQCSPFKPTGTPLLAKPSDLFAETSLSSIWPRLHHALSSARNCVAYTDGDRVNEQERFRVLRKNRRKHASGSHVRSDPLPVAVGRVQTFHRSLARRRFRHGIFMNESVSGKPSKGDFERMARRRFQSPTPKREGKWWFLLVWQDQFKEGRNQRRRQRIKLAPASMPVREVNKIAAEALRPLNQGLHTIGSATRFQDFINEVFEPVVIPLLAASTQDRYRGVLKNYLVPAFGELCLRDITALAAQRYFSGIATSALKHESRDKIRDVLASACTAAVQYGFLVKNPVEGIKLPPSKKGRKSKPFVTPERRHR